ncbi:MAG TPA: peptide ABC transporter substrate-binding protein [Candidatus Baltobacteraceae bacterium]|nr:peptide ABC transporter substrate-binding protein [Candidatus Baltobacteraceae bacterium]
MNALVSRLAAAALAAMMLASCTKTGTYTPSHELRVADGSGDIPTLNPHLFTETTLGYIAEMTQAYLVKYDADNRPYPELVTEVPTQRNGGISPDGKTITWHLRKGVRWSDGAPFTADDVVFSTHAVLNPANNEVGRDGWDLITGIDEPDKYTVVFHLRKPYSPYLPTFFGSAGANPSVLPKHILAGLPNINHAAYNAKPVGIGPFRVVAWRRSQDVEMEANPYYFRGLPKLKRVVYKLIPSFDTLVTQMQTHEVDLWPAVPSTYIDRVKSISGIRTSVVPSALYAHLDFNVTRPLVSDVRVREAIRYAIDRPEIVRKIVHGYGLVQDSTISPAFPYAPKNISTTPYDPAKARQLLDQAGWKVGPGGIRTKNGVPLSLDFVYYTGSASADDTVEFIRAELKNVGIAMQTRRFAPATFFAPFQDHGIVYGSKWDMTFFAWQDLPVPDISNTFECNQIPPNGQNVLHYCNAELDRLLEQEKATYDVAKQTALLSREEKIIQRDVPTIVLYILDVGFAQNEHLTGFHPGILTPFDDMMHANI